MSASGRILCAAAVAMACFAPASLLAGAQGPRATAPRSAGAPRAGGAVFDTTFAVERGGTLVFENFQGRLRVRSGGEDPTVRVVTRAGRRAGVTVDHSGRRWLLRRDRRGVAGGLEVTAPAWVRVEIAGHEASVQVEGIEGGIRVHTSEGDIALTDVAGGVEARTFEGTITVERGRGEFVLASVDDDVRLQGVSGRVRAETTDGDVRMTEMDADFVEASTLDGEVLYHGRVHRSGEYRLTSHDGDLLFAPLGPFDASVTVQTYDGELRGDLPVTLRRMGEDGMVFVAGEGGATVVLRTFDGDVRLSRSGSVPGRRPQQNDEEAR